MPGVDLERLFEELPATEAPGGDVNRLWAIPIPGFDNHRIARGVDGIPILLIASRDRGSRVYSAPILLENLSVQYELDCRVTNPSGSAESGVFSVISCSANSILQRHFLRVGSLVIEAVGANPSRLDISRTVDGFVELFRALTQPPRKTVQGLWAELFLIARSARPAMLAAAWHALPDDRYDFSGQEQRIEVKAAAGRSRRHHFSLEQLQVVDGTSVLIVSILIERAGGGLSLGALIEATRRRVSEHPQLGLRIESVVASTLGENLSRSLEDAFDAELAEHSLRLFQASQIPGVREVPPLVSEVRFRSDLNASVPIEPNRSWTGIFAGLLRQ